MSGPDDKGSTHGAYCRRDRDIATLQNEVKHLDEQDKKHESGLDGLYVKLDSILGEITQLKIGQTELRGNSSIKIMLAHSVGGMIPVAVAIGLLVATGQIKLW